MNCGHSLVETVKLLGCFSTSSSSPSLVSESTSTPSPSKPNRDPERQQQYYKQFHEIFVSDIGDFPRLRRNGDVPANIFSACVVLRMLYDMAVDNYEKSSKSAKAHPALERKTSPMPVTKDENAAVTKNESGQVSPPSVHF